MLLGLRQLGQGPPGFNPPLGAPGLLGWGLHAEPARLQPGTHPGLFSAREVGITTRRQIQMEITALTALTENTEHRQRIQHRQRTYT